MSKEFKEDIEIDVFYPDHPPRTDSALYRRTRHHLIDVLDIACWVCGSKDNRETHHQHVEWAYADGVDWDHMRVLHPDFNWGTFKTAEDFVDSEYNMLILCDIHHRHKNHGIHYLPFPIFVMQRYKRDDFIMFTEDAPKS
jgi:hypothetical protein